MRLFWRGQVLPQSIFGNLRRLPTLQRVLLCWWDQLQTEKDHWVGGALVGLISFVAGLYVFTPTN